MKKLLLIFLLIAIAFGGCRKEIKGQCVECDIGYFFRDG